MAIELFDLTKLMFTNNKKFNEVKLSDKAKHAFIINRFFSIKFPSNAQKMNVNGFNPGRLVNIWGLVGSRFTSVPSWIYTKTKKVDNPKIWKPNTEIARFWMDRFNLNQRDLEDAIKFNPIELKESFKRLEQQINMNK